jgi:hypothetical protein
VKLPGYRTDFYFYSGKVSDIARQLCFAGIAIIWLFKKDTAAGITVPQELVLPGAIIVSALAIDLIQYIIASLTWFIYYRVQELKGVSDEQELGNHSGWLEVPIWVAFVLKTAGVLAAYYLLIKYFFKTVVFS